MHTTEAVVTLQTVKKKKKKKRPTLKGIRNHDLCNIGHVKLLTEIYNDRVFVLLIVNVYLILFTYQNISELATRILALANRGHCVVFPG